MTHIIFTICRTEAGGLGSASSRHAGWLVAVRAEAMRPFCSSNATSQMEGKPIGHIHYVCSSAPHGAFHQGLGRGCGCSEDKGGAWCDSLGVGKRCECDVVERRRCFFCVTAVCSFQINRDSCLFLHQTTVVFLSLTLVFP